jgi:hypothetical protein
MSSSAPGDDGRALLLAFILMTSCSSTHVAFVGGIEADQPKGESRSRLLTSLEGTLSVGWLVKGARVELDPEFDRSGFASVAHPFVLSKGDDVVLVLEDDVQSPKATLFVAVSPELLQSHRVIADGEFIPYLDLRLSMTSLDREPHVFGAACKGGRGRLSIEAYSGDKIAGDVALALTCRTYVDGYEREESDLHLAGPFSLDARR